MSKRMKLFSLTFLTTCILIFNSYSFAATSPHSVQFDSGEHVLIGDNATLYYPIKVAGSYQYNYLQGGKIDFRALVFPKLAQPLDFGEIVAAPDLFAAAAQISDGKTFADRRTRFENSFAVYLNMKTTTLNKVYAIMTEETQMIKDAIAQGIQPSQAYAAKGLYFAKRYLLADPLSIQLFLKGWDHFEKYAHMSYQAGHAEALATALSARNATDPEQKAKLLVLAYAKEGYADHFLTDSFAAGHMRTPDKEIADIIAKEVPSQALAAVLAILMHNQDNLLGVEVTNARGDKWMAYGDTMYMDDVNKDNREIINETVQDSMNEIISAFLYGTLPSPDDYAANQLLPNLPVLDAYQTYVDSKTKVIPMFTYDDASDNVLRRKDLKQLYATTLPLPSSTMIAHGGLHGWWGWTTLLELVLNRQATNQPIQMQKLVTTDGNLTTLGMSSLASSLTYTEKALFCADPKTNKTLKHYLKCTNAG